MDTTNAHAQVPTAQEFYAALASEPVRLAMWRKLAAKLYAPETKPLATGETPVASAADARAEAGTLPAEPSA